MQTPEENWEHLLTLSHEELESFKDNLKKTMASEKSKQTKLRNKMFRENHLFMFDERPKNVPQKRAQPVKQTVVDLGFMQIEIDYDFDPRDEEAHIPEIVTAAGGREYNPWKDLPDSSEYNWIGYEDKFHDILLVRSIHTLMDKRCSLNIREEITEWINCPLIPEEKFDDPDYLRFLPFSFQACCIFAAVNPIELVKDLSFSLRMNHYPYEFDLLD